MVISLPRTYFKNPNFTDTSLVILKFKLLEIWELSGLLTANKLFKQHLSTTKLKTHLNLKSLAETDSFNSSFNLMQMTLNG